MPLLEAQPNTDRCRNARIRRAFSRAAGQYDRSADLQKDIGRMLLGRLETDCPPGRILDIGMGTGTLTDELSGHFSGRVVVGIDFAEGMVHWARRRFPSLSVVQADAHALPFAAGRFSCIFSNLALQWSWDLTAVLRECRRVTCAGGRLYITLFGKDSLKELHQVWRLTDLSVKDCAGRTFWLPDRDHVRMAVRQSGLKLVRLEAERRTMRFEDMTALLRWLKATGANTGLMTVPVGRDRLLRTNALYRKEFGDSRGIPAGFEVFWIELKNE